MKHCSEINSENDRKVLREAFKPATGLSMTFTSDTMRLVRAVAERRRRRRRLRSMVAMVMVIMVATAVVIVSGIAAPAVSGTVGAIAEMRYLSPSVTICTGICFVFFIYLNRLLRRRFLPSS